MARALIALGANLGDRRAALDGAMATLRREPALSVLAQSRWYETAAVGGPAEQPRYLNGAVLLETSLPPRPLLDVLRQVEDVFGRRRDVAWGPRTLDLDLLLYDRLVLGMPGLVVPHPRMAWRRFVLQPAAEIAADMLHPPSGWTVGRLWQHLNDSANYVALAGPIRAGKTRLAQAVAHAAAARLIAEPLDALHLETFYRNPAGHAWSVEVEFLIRRAQVLSAKGFTSPDGESGPHQPPAVSDFWFDQSWAFAEMWLPPGQRDDFRRRWLDARGHVVQPRLLVIVDAPPDVLQERIRQRRRPGENELSLEKLSEIRSAVLRLARQPGHGPVLEVDGREFDPALTEILAAVSAMQ